MVDRTVKATLRAEVGQYVSAMGQAETATAKVGDAASKSQQQADQAARKQQTQARSFSSSLAQSAKENEQAWNRVGNTMVGVGAGVTALGAAVLKTGISYNQLQQQSRAALTTLLGSAEAANAQMDKLDEFARTSPFSKQVFIEAQQQLIGFGMAAEDVIPTLDAVQQAVAATGGSNQDIAELVNVIAKVGAAGKLTAQDLNEFGARGVDAATIIGEQMGKTGAQIREDITAGALDADEAIAALTTGMQERFGGAADAVKDTFSGALDRVSAAWRDLSSTIAEPLVGSEGGGLLTGALNEIADFMRVIGDLPPAVLQIGAAATGVAGLVTLMGGALLKTIPLVSDFIEAVKTMGTDLTKAGSSWKTVGVAFGSITGALTIATIAVGAWAKSQAEAQARVDSLRDSLDATTGALTDQSQALVAEAWTEQAGLIQRIMGYADSAADAAQSLGIDLGTLTDAATGNADALEQVYSIIGENTYESAQLAKQNAEALGISESAYQTYATQVREALETQRSAISDARDEQSKMAEATGGAADAQGDMADATGEATDEVQAQVDAIGALIDAMATLAGQTLSVRDAHRKFEESIDEANGSLKENGQTLDITTAKGRENQAALDTIADSTWKWVDALKEQGASLETMQGVVADGRQAYIDMATDMGMSRERAENLADALGLMPDQIKLDTEPAQESLSDFEDKVAGLKIEDVEVGANTDPAREDVDRLEGDFAGLRIEGVEVTANTAPAQEMVNGLLVTVNQAEGTVQIDGNPQPADQSLNELLRQIGVSSEDVTINGNPIPADTTLSGLLRQISRSGEEVTIGGDDANGQRALAQLLRMVGVSESDIRVGANTGSAESAVNHAARDRDSMVHADAETYAAEHDLNNTARDRTSTITVQVNKTWSGPISKDMATGGPVEGFAAGGAVRGPGTGTSDSIVASGPAGPGRYRLSNGEHVWTDREVRSMGGHGNVMAVRSMARTGELRSVLGLADGGPLAPYGMTPAPAPAVTVSPQVSATAALRPEDIAQLASIAAGARRLEVNGRVFAEVVDETNRRFGGKGTL